MNEYISRYELPNNIERYLASLSKLYAQDGNRQFQEIIVNAQIRVHEAWSEDNWNGGTYGHAIYLLVPDVLFLNVAKQKSKIQDQIKSDLNKLQNVQNEFIDAVFIEMQAENIEEWRQDSGLLIAGQRNVSPDAAKRIWENDNFRIFLSHRSNAKQNTAYLKSQLSLFGMSCFVAHEDIHPTQDWQDEIENALASMDALVALITADFRDSDWTDQEIGYALGRGVTVIPVNLGKLPYGFIGKIQALPSDWGRAPVDIMKILIKNDRALSSYIQALPKCPNWTSGNNLAAVLPFIEKLTEQQIDDIVAAYNQNFELQGSFGFNGTQPRNYGTGLVSHLNRLGTRKFQFANVNTVISL